MCAPKFVPSLKLRRKVYPMGNSTVSDILGAIPESMSVELALEARPWHSEYVFNSDLSALGIVVVQCTV